ncbi:FAD-binding oxidoreductase [Bradyrhizobium sp. LHD-71]|uniref:FAD-dependent oxidoreductase n=1 Tax=Bradyrhizobium sp. LHD-71 TaxID=3072141 RepID=UPI00280D2128|nr:FAD-binding oxidoreductase [Bradyrhizobium sp. LHD-71]MDQ8729687.1 FAD-binding oxidoreductase [Bradyrhizobium sp. LHD-71]
MQAGIAAALLPSARLVAAPTAANAIVLNDASRLNPTPVAKVAILSGRDEENLLASLRNELREAAKEGRPVAVGGARHSMGGQSLARGGTAVSLETSIVKPDVAANVYRVGAGARWREVLAALDPLQLSPAVMQSNNDFSIGGTLSVNAHGWPVPFGPFGTTVKSFRMLLADGELVTCSRDQNADLFSLAVGGYGLFGVIIDAELAAASNWSLRARPARLPSDEFTKAFIDAANQPLNAMLYGRLSVSRDNFLRDALMVAYRSDGFQPTVAKAGKPSAAYAYLSRNIFRAQTGSETGKKPRWLVETRLTATVSPSVTRNELLNHPVAEFADSNFRRTDILHEYFVPPERLEDFLAGCREIIPRHSQDLLSVTLRYVGGDESSVLAYAAGPRIAAVMLFVQPMTPEANQDMQAMTAKLIDHVLSLGGSFYLPYRLHATRAQVRRAYPRAEEFIAAKRRFDPNLLFRNTLWDRYFG